MGNSYNVAGLYRNLLFLNELCITCCDVVQVVVVLSTMAVLVVPVAMPPMTQLTATSAMVDVNTCVYVVRTEASTTARASLPDTTSHSTRGTVSVSALVMITHMSTHSFLVAFHKDN